MKHLIFMALSALALSGCSGTHIKSPGVCNGKHRRPANLYGSILPTLPVPLPASQSAGQSLVVPSSAPAAASPAPQSSGVRGTRRKVRKIGALSTIPPGPRTTKRDIALSYLNC
jgi:hypothetical protein